MRRVATLVGTLVTVFWRLDANSNDAFNTNLGSGTSFGSAGGGAGMGTGDGISGMPQVGIKVTQTKQDVASWPDGVASSGSWNL